MLTGSIPALVTPFTQDGSAIDFAALRALVKMHIDEGSDAILVAGTTGEGPTLSDDEFMRLLECSIEASGGLIDVMVNCGTNDTKKSVERTQQAKQMGAKYALAIVPYYNKPNFTGITRHFEEVASVSLPTVVYHHPGRTGITLGAQELVTLHKIQGVIGIKEASSDPGLTKLICQLLPEARVYSGNDDLALDLIECGGVGSINIVGNVKPRIWGEIVRVAVGGKLGEARARYNEVRALIDAINLEINPQGIKGAMSIVGLCRNSLRLPLVEASAYSLAAIEKALSQHESYSV